MPLPAVPVTYEADVAARLSTVEYRTAIDDYMAAEVHPYVPDAWVDHDKTKIGYEIPLTRHFYKYVPPRPLAEIDAEIKQLEARSRTCSARSRSERRIRTLKADGLVAIRWHTSGRCVASRCGHPERAMLSVGTDRRR